MSNNDVAALNGFFKEVYVDQPVDLIPEGVVLYNEIPFVANDKQIGNQYHCPVILQLEHGFTYGGSDGSAFALNDPVAGQMKDAVVQGYEIVLRSTISIGAISRAGNDKKAFGSSTKRVVANMLKSFTRRLEIQLLYGQKGIGTVSSVSTNDLVLTAKSFAAGIWAGAEGMYVDVYDSGLSTKRGTSYVTAVNFSTNTITVAAAPGGTTGTDVVFFKGAKGNEFAGVEAIARNSGTMFGISAATYQMWAGNVVSNSGTGRAASMQLIEEAIIKSVEKGLADQDILILCNPAHWTDLLTEQAGKRSYDQSYDSNKLENGAKEIAFMTVAGRARIKPSIYCKLGHIFILPIEDFVRVGSRDITFDQPGMEGKFIKLMEGYHGYEMRAYTDQALFCECPGKITLMDDMHG